MDEKHVEEIKKKWQSRNKGYYDKRKKYFDNQKARAERDEKFAKVVISGFNNLLAEMNKLADEDHNIRMYKESEFNSYKSILHGMLYQESRARDTVEYAANAMSAMEKLERSDFHLLTESEEKALDDMLKFADIQDRETALMAGRMADITRKRMRDEEKEEVNTVE